ncbi:MAG: trehalase family glycosidase, partial [Bacteroidota bacterium]
IAKTGFLWNKPGTLQKEDTVIRATTKGRTTTIRALGTPTDNPESVDTPYFSFDSDTPMAFYTGRSRTLGEIKSRIAERKNALKTKNALYADSADAYEAIQSVVGWNMFYDAFNDRGISSVSRIWNQTWGGYIIFDWDTYFIALLASLEHKDLAYANVFAITRSITDGGFIPNVASAYEKSNDRSQPPVGAMTAKLIYDRYGEKWFLEEVYGTLMRWNRWWPKARDNQGYLSWGSHPHPKGMSAHTLQAAKWESGLDNSPMFDGIVFNTETNCMELASVGLMSLYIADCHYLASIAQELGKNEDARELTTRASTYAVKLNELWDGEMGLYRDKNLVTGTFTEHKSPTHFYPLLAQVPTAEQAQRMVEEHLMNPDEFHGEYMIPSISRDNAAFEDNSYWRGRIWAPMNFLVYMGLRNYDFPEAQKELSQKSRELIMQEWTAKRRIHENYNAVTGQGDDVRNSDPFYAWAGLLSYIAFMEEGYVK